MVTLKVGSSSTCTNVVFKWWTGRKRRKLSTALHVQMLYLNCFWSRQLWKSKFALHVQMLYLNDEVKMILEDAKSSTCTNVVFKSGSYGTKVF